MGSRRLMGPLRFSRSKTAAVGEEVEADLKHHLSDKVVWVTSKRKRRVRSNRQFLDETPLVLLLLECRGWSAKGQKVKHLMTEKDCVTSSAMPSVPGPILAQLMFEEKSNVTLPKMVFDALDSSTAR